MTRLALLLLALAASPQAAGQGAVLVEGPAGTLGAAPTAKVGTHETALGLAAAGWLPLGRAAFVQPSAAVEALVADLGLPGASLGAQVGLELGAAFGAARPARSADLHRRPLRAHAVSYAVLAYLDADGTSQLSGAVAYQHTGPAGSVEVRYENDAFAHQLLDRYRTAALRVRYLRHDRAVPVGVGVRAVLWTGTTEGLGRLHRDEAYDLTGQRGGDDPHGILALDLYHGDLTVSLGLDSEGIRSTLQNSFHYLIDDGQIPRLAGRRPRLVVRVALHETGGLY